MTIHPPQFPHYEVQDIKYKLNGQLVTVSRVILIKSHEIRGEWDYITDQGESSFVDRLGNIFYDRLGVPFQGRV